MYPSVLAYFRQFNEPEGVVPHMYLDIKGLVTVGVGNLIDPISEALALPFCHRDTRAPASQEEISDDWYAVKLRPWLAQCGAKSAAAITHLMLDDAAIHTLIERRLYCDESQLQAQPAFQWLDVWPADAQMAVLSMAWAMGPAALGGFLRFAKAAKAQDFLGAAEECKISEAGNPGIVPRNVANRKLLLNAAKVIEDQSDPSVLHYPADITAGKDTGRALWIE